MQYMTLPFSLVEKSNEYEFNNFEIKVSTKVFFIVLLFVNKIIA